MKYSIIIVAYNSPETLVKCMQSLVDHPATRENNEAEVVVCDNSPEPIESYINNELLKALLNQYVRVIFHRPDSNLGFSEGCNKAVSLSHGKKIVLVNPDTEVFERWAQDLDDHFSEGVGAVGPISNFVAGFQNYIFHMQPCQDGTWARTARMAAKGMRGRGVNTKLLIGFFLMIPREVWDEMGGLDPQFFLGCDDLDLSLRLRAAGYKLIIATDVFVYHEGHTSFYSAESASMAYNKQSEKRMLAKLAVMYPNGIPSSTELWGCEILDTGLYQKMTLSVCMIVRDEEKNLAELLPQLGFADEIVVVDTGETGLDFPITFPQEIESRKKWQLKIRLHSFPWNDSFSDARNFALSKCTGDYVLWLDADDRVDETAAKLIRAALDFPGPLTAKKQVSFSLRLRDHTPEGRFAYAQQPRIFPNIPGVKWEGRCHESYAMSLQELNISEVRTDIVIDHTGYSDEEILKAKYIRNLRLLRMDSDSPLVSYQIANAYSGTWDFKTAREWYLKCLSHKWEVKLSKDFVHQLNFRIAWDLYKENGGACPEMEPYLEGNEKPDALYFQGECLLKRGESQKARELYEKYLNLGEITDYFQCDQELFQELCALRIKYIALKESTNAA